MFENRDFVMALFAVVGAILWIIYMVINQRNIGALTAALKETRSDVNLIDQAHSLATDVVSVETLHKALDTINTFVGFVKTLTPDPVDAALDEAAGLANDVVNDTHTVRGVPYKPNEPPITSSEQAELDQQ